MENNIQYLLLGEFENAEQRGWHGAGWYFWDEADGQYCYGPFPSRARAHEEMSKYAEALDRQPEQV